MKPIEQDTAVRQQQLSVGDIEIITDTANPDKIELYILDGRGLRIEGGEFDRNQFIDWVLDFYNENF